MSWRACVPYWPIVIEFQYCFAVWFSVFGLVSSHIWFFFFCLNRLASLFLPACVIVSISSELSSRLCTTIWISISVPAKVFEYWAPNRTRLALFYLILGSFIQSVCIISILAVCMYLFNSARRILLIMFWSAVAPIAMCRIVSTQVLSSHHQHSACATGGVLVILVDWCISHHLY